MSDERKPVERVLDVVVFAPAGLALTFVEEFPKLVEKGRHRIEGQVHTARLLGQFAIQEGRRQLDKRIPRPTTGHKTAESHLAPTTAPPDTSVTDIDASSADPATANLGAEAGAGVNGSFAKAAAPQVGTLAIPGYDSLSASQVVERLGGLQEDELEEVRQYETAHRQRRTVLNRLDQLISPFDGHEER